MKHKTLAIIGIIVGIVAIPLFLIVDRWYSNPAAEANLQEYCLGTISTNENSKFKALFNNIGEASGKFYQCASSNEFLINGKHQDCSVEVELKGRRDFESNYFDPEWIITIDNDMAKQIEKASFKVQVFCNQKIWFLKRPCDEKNYKCEYIKKNNLFELMKK